MYVKQAFIFTFIALCPAVLADITCETSDGSPNTGDVTGTINAMRGKGIATCKQTNDLGSECTTMATDGTAAIAFCGTLSSMRCQDIGTYALDIQNKCLSNGKVGGVNDLGGTRVEIFHAE